MVLKSRSTVPRIPAKRSEDERQRALRGRRLVVVDIENLVGGAVLASAQAAWARRAIHEAIHLSGKEQVVIGTSHIGMMAVGLGWSGTRIVMRSGANGADKALIQVLGERIAARFDELVLASGDGIFSRPIAQLSSDGVQVTVLARDGHCSLRLQESAQRTVYLAPDYVIPPPWGPTEIRVHRRIVRPRRATRVGGLTR